MKTIADVPDLAQVLHYHVARVTRRDVDLGLDLVCVVTLLWDDIDRAVELAEWLDGRAPDTLRDGVDDWMFSLRGKARLVLATIRNREARRAMKGQADG